MKQSDLFLALEPLPEPAIPGLSFIAGCISPEHEQSLLSAIDQNDWLSDLRRRVQHYGYGVPCVMEFLNPGTGEKRKVLLEPQSLVVLSGPARYEWLHAIPARKSDVIGGAQMPRARRVSLTFRRVIL